MSTRSFLPLLVRLYVVDLVRNRLLLALLLCWVTAFAAGISINMQDLKTRAAAHETELHTMEAELEKLPSFVHLFTNFYVVRRPPVPLGVFVSGTDYGTPEFADYRPRFAPTMYTGDDVDPLRRLFRPVDVTLIVGVLGFLIAIFFAHDAVNGEISKRNAHQLLLFGASMRDIFIAKVLSNLLVVAATFLVVFSMAVAYFFWRSPFAAVSQIPGLIGVGFVAFLYIFFAVTLVCVVSTLVRNEGRSLMLSTSIFLFLTFVVPCAIDAAVPTVSNPSAHEAAEQKTLISRKLHEAIDADLVVSGKTVDEYKRGWNERDLDRKTNDFIRANSDATVEIGRQYRHNVYARSRRVEVVTSLLSPFACSQSAMTTFADTSVANASRLEQEMTEDYFLKYREWYMAGVAAGRNEPDPVNYINTPGNKKIDFSEIGRPQYPYLRLREKLALAGPSIGWLCLQIALLVCAGIWASGRLERRELPL